MLASCQKIQALKVSRLQEGPLIEPLEEELDDKNDAISILRLANENF